MKKTTPGASAPQSAQADKPSITGACGVDRIMSELWERAKDGLSASELGWFKDATERASFITSLLARVTDDLGCLISHDSSCKTGEDSLRGEFSEAELLWFIAESLRNIQGLIEIGDNASYRLHEMNQGGAA